MSENTLRPIDLATQTWDRIKAHYETRLLQLRAQNDNATLTELQTALIRGRIAEIKNLLALENPAPITAVNPID